VGSDLATHKVEHGVNGYAPMLQSTTTNAKEFGIGASNS
jgi:hypothetical protein